MLDNATARAAIGDLGALTQATPLALETTYGPDAVALLAYLRAHPEALTGAPDDPIATSRRLLAQSLDAHRGGDAAAAYDYAVAAYLEGFELVEPRLRTLAPHLVPAIETAMMGLRAAVKQRDEAIIAARHAEIQALLTEAEARLNATEMSSGMGFASAFIILVREGLEAILVLAAIATFLIKTGRRDAMRYLHAGWLGALAVGFVTWLVAKYLLHLSGAGRELTEGVTALFATAMLVYIGCWLHDYSHARRWQLYLHEKVTATLARGTLWSLATVSFIAVYREILETILFYETLFLQAGDASVRAAIFSGMGVAAAALLLLAFVVFRAAMRLPLRLFFNANTALMFVLAVIFAGKGIAALQEAGRVGASPIAVPTIDVFGIYPTLQSVGLQVALVLLMAGYLVVRRLQAQRESAH
jgi:high-affinity iron transporter